MSNIAEFLGFEHTPADKMMGIATVKLYGKIVVKYKIVSKKDGTGVFPSIFSQKVTLDGEESYLEAFIIDSRSENDDVLKLVMTNVKRALSGGNRNNEHIQSRAEPDFVGEPAPKDEDCPF